MMKLKTYLLTALIGLFSITSFAQKFDTEGIPLPPNPPRLVNDWSGLIPDGQEQKLEAALEDLALSSKTRVVVVTINTLNDYEKAQFAYEIGEKWGVGDAQFDNGVVVLVKPKEVDGRGEVFIATGYGLEGIIPDAVAKRIVEKEMIPRFKQQDYAGGIVAGLQIVSDLALKEYPASSYMKTPKKRRRGSRIPFFAIVFVFILLSSLFGRRRRGYRTMGGSSLPWWAAIFAMNSMSRGSGWSDFSSGSGGFGGGGFGGFGGGSFGGGGAGGSW